MNLIGRIRLSVLSQRKVSIDHRCIKSLKLNVQEWFVVVETYRFDSLKNFFKWNNFIVANYNFIFVFFDLRKGVCLKILMYIPNNGINR